MDVASNPKLDTDKQRSRNEQRKKRKRKSGKGHGRESGEFNEAMENFIEFVGSGVATQSTYKSSKGSSRDAQSRSNTNPTAQSTNEQRSRDNAATTTTTNNTNAAGQERLQKRTNNPTTQKDLTKVNSSTRDRTNEDRRSVSQSSELLAANLANPVMGRKTSTGSKSSRQQGSEQLQRQRSSDSIKTRPATQPGYTVPRKQSNASGQNRTTTTTTPTNSSTGQTKTNKPDGHREKNHARTGFSSPIRHDLVTTPTEATNTTKANLPGSSSGGMTGSVNKKGSRTEQGQSVPNDKHRRESDLSGAGNDKSQGTSNLGLPTGTGGTSTSKQSSSNGNIDVANSAPSRKKTKIQGKDSLRGNGPFGGDNGPAEFSFDGNFGGEPGHKRDKATQSKKDLSSLSAPSRETKKHNKDTKSNSNTVNGGLYQQRQGQEQRGPSPSDEKKQKSDRETDPITGTKFSIDDFEDEMLTTGNGEGIMKKPKTLYKDDLENGFASELSDTESSGSEFERDPNEDENSEEDEAEYDSIRSTIVRSLRDHEQSSTGHNTRKRKASGKSKRSSRRPKKKPVGNDDYPDDESEEEEVEFDDTYGTPESKDSSPPDYRGTMTDSEDEEEYEWGDDYEDYDLHHQMEEAATNDTPPKLPSVARIEIGTVPRKKNKQSTTASATTNAPAKTVTMKTVAMKTANIKAAAAKTIGTFSTGRNSRKPKRIDRVYVPPPSKPMVGKSEVAASAARGRRPRRTRHECGVDGCHNVLAEGGLMWMLLLDYDNPNLPRVPTFHPKHLVCLDCRPLDGDTIVPPEQLLTRKDRENIPCWDQYAYQTATKADYQKNAFHTTSGGLFD